MSKIMVYGIPNCDTTKKAMKLLDDDKTAYIFHDYRQSGITKEKLQEWSNKAGWETVLNKRSTTWKELSAAEQKKVTDQSSAIELMLKNNTVIKRPIVESGNKLVIGFKEAALKEL